MGGDEDEVGWLRREVGGPVGVRGYLWIIASDVSKLVMVKASSDAELAVTQR